MGLNNSERVIGDKRLEKNNKCNKGLSHTFVLGKSAFEKNFKMRRSICNMQKRKQSEYPTVFQHLGLAREIIP